MPFFRLPSDTAVANSTTLASVMSTASMGTNTDWIAEISLRVSLAADSGGLRFNVRLPAGATAIILQPFAFSFEDRIAPATGLPWAGIGINVGATAADYFMLDTFGQPVTGIIYGQIGLRNGGTAGAAVVEACRNRTGTAGATTLHAFSILSARAP